MKYFWTNTIWYVLIGIITIIQVFVFMIHTDNRKLAFAIFLTVTGSAFGLELTIYAFFKSYMYFPMIIRDVGIPDARLNQIVTRFFDGVLGNYFSQFSIGATSTLIIVLKLKKYWYFLTAGIYGVIEELFKFLGIYEQYWYRTWMTVVSLIILFWFTEKLYNKAFQGMGNVIKYIVVFLGTFTLFVFFDVIPLVLLGIYHNLNLISDPTKSESMGFTIEFLILLNVIMVAYYLKFNLQWHALLILLLAVGYYFAWKKDFILIGLNDSGFAVAAFVSIAGVYLYVIILDRIYSRSMQPSFY